MPLLIILGAFALLPVLCFYRAVCLHAVYGWFLLPLGAPSIGVAHIYGISLILSLALPTPTDENRKTEWATELISPALLVFIGWITKGFM